MKQKIILILLLSSYFMASSQVGTSELINETGQDTYRDGYRHVITGSPFFIASKILKFNYDYLGLHKHYSIGVGLFTSLDSTKYDLLDPEIEVKKNIKGIDINNKFYLHNVQEGAYRIVNFYFNLGLNYTRMNFSYNADLWTPFYIDGIRYFSLENTDVETKLNRYAAIPQIGIVIRMNRFHMEHYIGARYYIDQVKDNAADVKLETGDFHHIGTSVFDEETLNSPLKRLVVGMNLGYTF